MEDPFKLLLDIITHVDINSRDEHFISFLFSHSVAVFIPESSLSKKSLTSSQEGKVGADAARPVTSQEYRSARSIGISEYIQSYDHVLCLLHSMVFL